MIIFFYATVLHKGLLEVWLLYSLTASFLFLILCVYIVDFKSNNQNGIQVQTSCFNSRAFKKYCITCLAIKVHILPHFQRLKSHWSKYILLVILGWKSFAVNGCLKAITYGFYQTLSILPWEALPGFYYDYFQLLLVSGSSVFSMILGSEKDAMLCWAKGRRLTWSLKNILEILFLQQACCKHVALK